MKKITRTRLETFLKEHATTDPILDVGAGRVETNHSYTAWFPNRHTVDIDPARRPDTVGDIHDLPFEDGSHRFVLCTEVLEHCHTPARAVSELHRVLAPGGKLVLTTRFVFPIHDAPHDYFRYTRYGLEHLFRDWHIEEIVPESLSFSAIGALLQRLVLQVDFVGGRWTRKLVYLAALLCTKLDGTIRQEYGDASHKRPDRQIMTTGYYIVARKRTEAAGPAG